MKFLPKPVIQSILRGETLDLRLYETGEAEFDYYPPPDPGSVGQAFQAVRKRSKLGEGDVEHFLTLLNEPDLASAKPDYLPTKPILDSHLVKLVTYSYQGRERIIV